MDKNLFSITILSAIIVLCSYLYHIPFFWYFDFNILSVHGIVSCINDCIANVSIPFFMILTLYLFIKRFKIPKESIEIFSPKTTFGKMLIMVAILDLLRRLILCILYFSSNSEMFWGEILHIFIVILSISYLSYYKTLDDIDSKYEEIFLLIYLPILFFTNGGKDAQLIYNNKSYKYIVNFKSSTNKYIDNNSNGDTLKLVSIGDKNSVFTDLKNEEIFLIPIEELPPLKSK